ncbi:hypothetical protein SLS60_005990 [Paraconiothyrium brasiliense]|uniref:Uncharacterized protein n=1 Tax=Paraconiothyrium brasiliense TaxID=300254 RepID=A0ABR3RDQ7_9PLEO
MGFWKLAKFAVDTALDHIEGKEAPPKYKLHPDSAYLGNKYYSNDTHLVPQTASSRAATYSRRPAVPVALPSLGTSPPNLNKKQTPSTSIMKPHVYIGRTPIHTLLSLPKEKYTVLRQSDLVNDDKIDRTVGWDRDLYWVIKGAVVLMVKERSGVVSTPIIAQKQNSSEAVKGVSAPPLKTYKSSKNAIKEAIMAEGGGMKNNSLNSPSVEGRLPLTSGIRNPNLYIDFFAGIFDIDQSDRINSLPPNPLAKTSHATETAPCTATGKQASLHPLDYIPRTELVVIFAHDTKELFVRKSDGKLYPVIWKLRNAASHRPESGEASAAVDRVKCTHVEGEMDVDDDGFMDVEFV